MPPNENEGAIHIKRGGLISMKKIITISREFGAYGGTIGRKVADELGYYYFDKDMIIHAALESGTLSPDEIRIYDERVPRNFGFGQSLFDFYNKPLDQRLYEAQREAIKKVADKGNCVIVGRNSNIILQEYDKSLHVFISASKYFRVKHLKEEMPEYTEEQIEEKMKTVDKARKKYCTYHTDTEFGNADFYDMCLKSSTFGVDKCVEMIVAAAK